MNDKLSQKLQPSVATYSAYGDKREHICHLPAPGKESLVQWQA